MIIAARLQLKGGSFRDLPLTKELSDSLEEWFAFLESVKGVRLPGGGVDFAGSPLIFPGRDGAPFFNQAFNARIKLACERARVPVISAHPLRHRRRRSCSTNAEPTCTTSRRFLDHKRSQPPRATRILFRAPSHTRWKPPAALVASFSPHEPTSTKGRKGGGEIAAKAAVQLLFSTGKSFTVDGLREKLREFSVQVRAQVRPVAALSNVELITALLSCNRQLALVGLQLRIINGVVSLLTTEVRNRALAAYLSEHNGANAKFWTHDRDPRSARLHCI